MGSDSTKSMASNVFRPDQSSICSNDLHILHWLCERANITCYNDDISQFVDLVANHVWVSIHGGCPKIDGFFRGNTKISKMSWITRGSPWYPYDSGNQHVLTSMMYNSKNSFTTRCLQADQLLSPPSQGNVSQPRHLSPCGEFRAPLPKCHKKPVSRAGE